MSAPIFGPAGTVGTAGSVFAPFLPAADGGGSLSWLDLIALEGEAGRGWVEEFSRGESDRLATTIGRALGRLRQGDLGGGRAQLDEVEREIAALPWRRASIELVLRRLHLAAASYRHYLEADFDHADRCMVDAESFIERAIELEPMLSTLAFHCPELRIQRAKICRNRHQWAAMKAHLDLVIAMLEDRHPLCTLPCGRTIFQHDLAASLRSTAAEDTEKGQKLFALVERPDAGKAFRAVLFSMYAFPGWMLDYP